MKKSTWITLGVVLGVVILLIILMMSAYNGMVGLNETVTAKESDIQVLLQRRMDLVPNLVNTVQGFNIQEQTIIEDITNARAQMSGATNLEEQVAANDALSGALSRLLVVVENYPELKSNALFTQLMDELAGTENRISVARQDYNTAVQAYNAKVKRFPNNILAGLFGFSEKPYFEADPAASAAPQVSFGQ